jgi:biopolymer transport protein ExbD
VKAPRKPSVRIPGNGDKGWESRDARRPQPPVEMDMNPMVDMAFLLLTFFMLATTFSMPQAMEILMPPKPQPGQQEQEQPIKESKALTLLLGNDDRVYWYRGISEPELHQTGYGPGGLLDLLRDLNAEVSGLVVLLKPLDDSRYENLVDALDDLAVSQTERYALVRPSPADLALMQQTQRSGGASLPASQAGVPAPQPSAHLVHTP